ncbi:MAG: lytic transglycosylase domain-containing protein [Deltaproteobacteria bacterium]|nr:lytic transglycosylase domain-containing protein [Deltaproteobacteria bacterium]
MHATRVPTKKTLSKSFKYIVRLSLYSALSLLFVLALYANYIKGTNGHLDGIFLEPVNQLSQNNQRPIYLDLDSSEKKAYLDYLLDDPESLVSDEFQIPNYLRERVLFWFQVYTIYENTDIILHHRDQPWKIFSVVDVSGLSEKERLKKVVTEIRRLKEHRGHIREQQGMRNSIHFALEKSGEYIRTMENIFEEEGLPIELTRLPIVESSFNPKAYSKNGAMGLWQFMRRTGRHFLDNIHSVIDERLNPFKSSYAAAQLLRENYQILKSWPLAISAYHHGPGILRSAMKKLQTSDISVIIKKYRHPDYGFASKNYYTEFLAALFTDIYHEKLFAYINRKKALLHEDVVLEYSMRIQTLLEICHISIEELRLLNPDLKKKAYTSNYYLPESYWLKVPVGKKQYIDAFHEEARFAQEYIENLEKNNH